MQQSTIWLGVVGVASLAAIAVYNKPFTNRADRVTRGATFSVNGNTQLSTMVRDTPLSKSSPAQVSSTEEPAWLTDAQNDPDPRVRLNVIEAYARNPGDSLDPFTRALVDPDEEVRTRAQELLEEALARR